eukprot:3000991-Pleurochrysis_carterae.AAC.3
MGDMHSKIRHFADDMIGPLKIENELVHFQQHITTFRPATNMLENSSKRDILPLGKVASTEVKDRITPPVLDPATDTLKTPGWVESGGSLISLGISIGNTRNVNHFLEEKYKGQKIPQLKLKV